MVVVMAVVVVVAVVCLMIIGERRERGVRGEGALLTSNRHDGVAQVNGFGHITLSIR